jgi:hypothetical protein
MIRRNPTLIPMNDADVQDVRLLVARQKVDGDRKQRAYLRMKEMAERPIGEEDEQVLKSLKGMIAERNARLGVQDGPSTSSGQTSGTNV